MEKFWITADGRVIRLLDLGQEHLESIIRHLENTAKVSALQSLLAASDAGEAVPANYSWCDFLPRIYDRLIEERDRRQFKNTAREITSEQLTEAWLRKNYGDAAAQEIKTFLARLEKMPWEAGSLR